MIGLVGKPSSGKSTTLNALTDASAKVGAFPFTTIDPNKATGYVPIECACQRFNKQQQCHPNHGWCENGKRFVPIVLLDVAGLVPGAHEGRGLGNKFLDDLRHADALIHVVDVSGTTDAEGKSTRGYDPTEDVRWLQEEIFRWVRGNLLARWPSITRRHAATKSTNLETLGNQLAGYGATRALVQRTLITAEAMADKLRLNPEYEHQDEALGSLEHWTPEQIDIVVHAFLLEKFPTVLALNKVDHPDSDTNIARISRAWPDQPQVVTSAISEVFLKKLSKQGYIKYEQGTEFVDTSEDLPDAGLKPLDPKLKERLETVLDLVLYRFGSTGVANALKSAIDALELVPVWTVRNIHDFGGAKAFPDCMFVRKGTTIGSVRAKIMGDAKVMYVEGVNGLKLSEDAEISAGVHDVLSFRVGVKN